MVKRCCVENCKSGQTIDGTAQNIASSFSLPKNAETRAKWLLFLQASGVTKVPKTARICENHFTKEEVRKEFKSVDKHGNVLLQRKFGHASLVSGAVPTIFSPMSNNNNVIQQSVVESLPHTKSNITAKNNQDESQPSLTMSDNIEPVVETVTSIIMSNCTKGMPNDNTNQKAHDEENKSVFNQVFHGTTILRLPNTTWGMHRVELAEKLISFIYLRHHPTENNGQPYTVKQITFDENLNFKTCILNKYTPISRANPQTVAEMESLIEEFHNTTVCMGGPRVAMYKNAVLRSAYKDICNRWRHNLCPLRTDRESTCKYCVRVYRTADTYYYVHNKSRMPRLPSTPSTKKKIDILRKTKRIQDACLRRNQVRLSHVREELKTLSKKDFSLTSRELFEEVIKKLNIPYNQVQYSSMSCNPFATKIMKIR